MAITETTHINKIMLIAMVISSSSLVEHVRCIDYDLVYWEMPPFLYTKDNKLTGIFKDTWDISDKVCMAKKQSLRPVVRMNGYKEFVEYMRNPNIGVNYTGSAKLHKANGNLANWFPTLTLDFQENQGVRKKQLEGYTMSNIPGLAVFARREEITLIYKMYLSLKATWQVWVLLLLTLVVAIIVWLTESWINDEIRREFTHGSLKSLWLGFVTMTTVGYGDVAAKSFVGRIVMVLWMVFGLIFASGLTAFASEGYYQTRHLGVDNKTVASLRHSVETKIIRDYWKYATVKEYDSYEDILQALRDKEVQLSLINAWVAAYLQADMNANSTDVPLAVVSEIKEINIPVGSYLRRLTLDHFDKNILGCLASYLDKAKFEAEKKHVKNLQVEKIYIPPLSELFGELNEITWLVIAVAAIIFMGGIWDVLYLIRLSKKGDKTKYEFTDTDDINSSGTDLGTLKRTRRNDAEERNDEFTTLPECAEELLRLGKELAMIKQSLSEVADHVTNNTTTHNNNNNNKISNMLQLEQEKYNGNIIVY